MTNSDQGDTVHHHLPSVTAGSTLSSPSTSWRRHWKRQAETSSMRVRTLYLKCQKASVINISSLISWYKPENRAAPSPSPLSPEHDWTEIHPLQDLKSYQWDKSKTSLNFVDQLTSLTLRNTNLKTYPALTKTMSLKLTLLTGWFLRWGQQEQESERSVKRC